MGMIERPHRNCIHPGCRLESDPQHPRCPAHHHTYTEAKWMTPTKKTKVYHSKEYHRERAAVMRDRGSCHLSHLAGCNGTMHYHSTRPPSHARNDCAVLCQRHHMQLERQGKGGALAQELARVMTMMGVGT